ncbi:NUDIX hydrolase domain-like protein [Mycena rebaudengoi]|nr:NUDIX hydrolase domain-like protein [Mycena rebaudengoi]
MVVIQPSTLKVVVLYESKEKHWFLPKGRKDIGESLEQAALREAHEESGYRVEFLPLYIPTCAPIAPNTTESHYAKNCEPIYISTTSYPARKRSNWTSPGGTYIVSWYVGQIPQHAVRQEGTGMPDEANYETYLLDVKDAVRKLESGVEAQVVEYAWRLFKDASGLPTLFERLLNLVTNRLHPKEAR